MQRPPVPAEVFKILRQYLLYFIKVHAPAILSSMLPFLRAGGYASSIHTHQGTTNRFYIVSQQGENEKSAGTILP